MHNRRLDRYSHKLRQSSRRLRFNLKFRLNLFSHRLRFNLKFRLNLFNGRLRFSHKCRHNLFNSEHQYSRLSLRFKPLLQHRFSLPKYSRQLHRFNLKFRLSQ